MFQITKGNKKRRNRRQAGNVRGLALLLSLILCLESAPLTALAAETDVQIPVAEEGEITPVEESGTPPEGKEEEPPAEDGETSPEGEEKEPSAEEGEAPPEEEEKEPSAEEGETSPVEEEKEPSAEDDGDSVSENDLSSVSENDMSSLSENNLDAERDEMIKKAQKAFAALLAEKPLMALLYHADSYDARRKADADSQAAASLEIGQTLYIQGVEITEDDVWYRVQYLLNGTEGTGYVQSYYLAYSDEDWLAWEKEYLFPILALGKDEYKSTAYGMAALSMVSLYAVDNSDISAFPGSYQADLRSLKNAHPNWTFVPMRTGLDFNTSVSKEMGAKSLIQKTDSNTSKGWVGNACPTESGWYYATQPAVAYHMDPRNFLTETYIFQFEQLTFNASYHTESAVQTFLNGTFMKGKLADDSAGRTYAKAFFEIGSSKKLSPTHLAARVYQEQGQGTSGLISGTYPGYEGYYNFFNVGVNGSSTAEKIEKGLTYAKNQGWNTRYKSLEGGAGTIGNNYILKGQDTIYLEKFNVNTNSPYGVYEHQYMQNIQAPRSESSSTKKIYTSAGALNSAFVFKIPVFNNMPDDNEIPLESISLDKETVTLRRPDTVVEDTKNLSAQDKAENISETTLQVRFQPADSTADKTIVWTSADQKIAKVMADPQDSSKAVVTAVGTGEVKITAKASKAGNQTAVCLVRVIAPIYRLELNDLSAEESAGKTGLFQGQSIALNAEYWPKDTTSDHTIVWSSSNEKAATVRNGRVTAVGEGKATITAAVAGYSASIEADVKVCKIIFHMEDGSVWKGKELSLGYGGCVADAGALPEVKNAAGKIFRGWYTEKDGRGSVFTESYPVYAEETHVYPHYQAIGAETGFYVIPVGEQIYTGNAIKPKLQVFDGTVAPDGSLIDGDDGEVLELVEGRDYTLSYKNNKNVNVEGKARPTITVKGKGNYAGTQQVFFDIVPKALTDGDMTADDITAAYNGRVIKSAPAVWRNDKKLVKNKDYTVTYPQTGSGAYQAAGVYPIVIKGKDGYTGTITVYETITKKTLMSKVSVARIGNQTYSKEQMASQGGIHPASLKVTYKGETLKESTDGGRTGDYTVAYTNDAAIGTATATIMAVEGSEYAGSKSVTYKIVGTSIARAKAEGIETKTHTGAAGDVQQSGYTLTLDDKILVESKDGGKTGDYVVSYAGAAKTDAVKAGTATIIFQGINEYSGQLKKNYKIQPYPFDEAGVGDITLAYRTQDAPEEKEIPLTDINGITTPYVKGGSKPVITVVFRGQTLEQGKDYTVSYKNHKALTTAETEEKKLPAFTISGRGNFKGKMTGTFTITDGRMDKAGKVTMIPKDVVYRERKDTYKTKVALKDVSGASLVAGRDYDRDLQYDYAKDATVLVSEEGTLVEQERKAGESVGEEDIPKVGTVIRVTAKGIGAYAGETGSGARISASYRIVAADIAKAKVQVAAISYQDGRPVTLKAEDLTVTMNGVAEPLVFGKDFVIDEESYVNNTKNGRAKVTLHGLGNYGGEKIITYSIGAKRLWW